MKRRLFLALLFALVSMPLRSAEWDAAKLAQLRPTLQSFVDQGEVAGAVAAAGDSSGIKILEVVGYRDLDAKAPMQKDSLFRIASMTKPITTIGIFILADEGKLSPDDPVSKWFPEFKDKRFEKSDKPVLLRHLMTHTSGMPGGMPKELSDLYQKRNRTLAEAMAVFAQQPLAAEPFTKWAYCNLGIDMLGRIIEIESGQSYEDFMQKRVFAPLEMADTCFYPDEERAKRVALTYGKTDGKLVASKFDVIGPTAGAKYPIPAGGLYSTADDLGKIYRMMLNKGELAGKRIISTKAVATMTALQTGEINTGFVPGMGFGFGFAHVRQPQGVTEMLSPGTFGHGGAFGTQGWIDPHKDMFIIFLIQRTGLANGDASDMRKQVQQVVVAALK